MKIGFTGTETGMTMAQQSSFLGLCVSLGLTVFHHGDCVGADAEAHDIVWSDVGWGQPPAIHIHPPSDNKKRAFKAGYNRATPKSYLERNHDIVNETEALIACPKGDHELAGRAGGGVWATVRYARSQGRPVFVIWPDGHVD